MKIFILLIFSWVIIRAYFDIKDAYNDYKNN